MTIPPLVILAQALRVLTYRAWSADALRIHIEKLGVPLALAAMACQHLLWR